MNNPIKFLSLVATVSLICGSIAFAGGKTYQVGTYKVLICHSGGISYGFN